MFKRKDVIRFVTIVGIFFAAATVLHFFKPEILQNIFGTDKSLSDIYTWLGAASGAFIVLWQLSVQIYRNGLQQEYNSVIAKGNLDNRFKDASLLLGNENTSACLAGIYALNQIAVDAHADGRDGYVGVIKKILCAILREGEFQNRPFIVQTILDVLFKGQSAELFSLFPTPLSGSVLKEMNFENANLQKADLSNACLEGSNFKNAILAEAYLRNADLTEASFDSANLYQADLNQTKLNRAWLNKAILAKTQMNYAELKGATLSHSTLNGAQFGEAHLEGADFYSAEITDSTTFTSAFINDKTNFFETSLFGKSIDAITKK